MIRAAVAGNPSWIHRSRRIGSILALLVLSAVVIAHASASPLQLHLEVYINDHPTNLIAEVFREPDGRLQIRREQLAGIGIEAPGSGKPSDLIGMETLPGLSMRYDEAGQKLHLAVPDRLRLAREYNLRGIDNEKIELSKEYGTVLNYNVFGTSARGYSKASRIYNTGSLSLDARAFSPYGMVQSSVIAGQSLVQQGFLRLETAYVFASRDSMTQTTIGDSISGGLNWTRPIRFGGGQFSKSLALRPDLVTSPLPNVSGSAAVPSTVDVYVDNVRIASQEVGAGPYRITNLPVSGSTGTARVVVRDVTGRETVTALPFYTSAKLLRQDAMDYSLDAGFARQNYAMTSFDYSRRVMGIASGRYGLRDWITLEGQASAAVGFSGIGLGATINAGQFGVFSGALAGSRHAGQLGGMSYASWELGLRGVFVGMSTQRTFGQFEDIASVTARRTPQTLSANLTDAAFYALNRSPLMPKAMDRLTLGFPVAGLNVNLSANLINIERAEGDRSRLLMLTYSHTLASRYNLFASAFSDIGSRRQIGLTAGLSFTLGDNLLATATLGGSHNERSASFEVAKAAGPEDGSYGWRAYNNEGSFKRRGAQVSANTPYARTSAGLRLDNSSLGGYGEIDGALVVSPSGVFATRRVQDAFAVVDVGAPDVEVLHENRPVGRTGRNGRLVIPDLQSLQRSKIAINPDTMPAHSHATITEALVMPSLRGSATLNIRTMQERDTAMVEIVDANGKHFPVGTRVVLKETGAASVIGYGGAAYLTEIGDINTLDVETEAQPCVVSFKRKDRADDHGKVGPLTCGRPS
jgi:outer membrane usher protein